MSVNRERPHIFVLPEDDANRQIANGFHRYPALHDCRFQVLEVAGGWTRVLDLLNSDHSTQMVRWPERLMVLLIDFDGNAERLEQARFRLPPHVSERVFLLGAWTNPEALRHAGLGSYEQIGLAMARDCHNGTSTTWGHDLLRHNAIELGRLASRANAFLFS